MGFSIGVAVGAVCVMVVIFPSFDAWNYSYSLSRGLALEVNIFFGWLMHSLHEELMRTYWFQNFLLSLPTSIHLSMRYWFALAASSLLFALGHAANPFFSASAFCVLTSMGFFLGSCYEAIGTLWFAVGFHVSWNYILVALNQVVSGFDVFAEDPKNHERGFGPEEWSSSLLLMLLLCSMTQAYRVWKYKKRRVSFQPDAIL